MTDTTIVSPSGAVTAYASMSGDEFTVHISADASAGDVAVREAVTALDVMAQLLRAIP